MDKFRGLIMMSSSSSSRTICGICMEDNPIRQDQMFINKGNPCAHTFCVECISKHVKAKVEGNITVISCPEPDCNETLEPCICQGIIAEDVFEMWGTALFRSSLCSGSAKTMNCPFEDCSEMFMEDRGMSFTAMECLYCHRLFCTQCNVPWHLDMQCEDFLKMKKNKKTMKQKVDGCLHVGRKQSRQALDDQIFLKLAKEKKWRKCPNCKFYVQKVEGCSHIICRCKFEFCYKYGSKWRDAHVCFVRRAWNCFRGSVALVERNKK